MLRPRVFSVRVFVFILAFVCAATIAAQEFRATISGRVLDPSGASISGAQLTAVNVDSNESSSATSSSAGVYTLPFLRPGVYRVTVRMDGFKTLQRDNVTVQVGQIIGLDLTLEVGAVSETVEVTSEAALLDTQTASRQGIINTKQVTELPLNSRNPFMLGAMMSGVTFRGAAIWQRPFDNGAIAEWSVNGGRQSNNEFLMDGAPNNGQAGGNNIAYVPIVDAVQEFSVQQNSYDAQYGKTAGGVFNVVLKSGTPTFHATGWWFLRRRPLDANTFQNNAITASASNPEGGAPRPDHTLDQYGFQLEGPVYVPKLLKKDGAVKLFYLGSFENYRENWPQFLRNSYPEMDMRGGDFSKLVTAGDKPQLIGIYDPFTTTFSSNGDPIRTPFANNRIPSSRINPVAAAVTKFMPEPNAITPGVGYAQQNRLNPEYAAKDKFYNLILKFDWQFGDNHRAYIRHASNDRTEDRCTNGICDGPGTEGQQPFQRINDAYVADWVWTITPTSLLNIRASSNRFIESGRGQANADFDLTSLGLPASLVGSIPGPAYFGRWEFREAGNQGTTVYANMGRGQSINITNNYNLMANLTKIMGNHTMKMGSDLRRIHYIQQNSGDILLFRFRGNWTQRLWNQPEANAGNPYADFLLGLSGYSQNPNDTLSNSNFPVYPFYQQWYFAPYFQDDWKVNRKLTLNLGLRWDFNQAPSEKYDRINRGFDSTVASPVANQIPAEMLTLYPQLRDLKGGLAFAGVDGNPRVVGNNNFGNFQPRIGVAYSLNEKTVLRGGYGLFYMNPNNDYLNTTGFSTNTPLVATLDDGRTPIPNAISNPYPGGINQPSGSKLGAATFVGRDSNWFNPNFETPYVHQFSFGIQRQITQTSTFEFTYAGSRTIGANDQRDFNLPSADFRKQCNILEGGDPNYCNAAVTNPFKGLAPFQGTQFYTANTISRYQLNRPFPQFNGNLQERGLNTSKIWYNSLQLNFNQRIGNDLTLLGNYTFSKMVERWGFNDPFNNVSQQGLYFNDRPHYVKFNTVYELPFGKGKKFGGAAGKAMNLLVGGWTVSTYTQFSSGEPNNLPGNAIPLLDPRTAGGDWDGSVDWQEHQVKGWNPCVLRQFNDGTTRPQAFSIARGCSATDFSQYAWLMTADYAPRFTPSRSGQIRKQSLFNVDMSIGKDFQITERARAQFRAEAFNLTNYYYFGRDNNFETNPNSPNFGTQFPSQAWIGNGYPRQIQLGLKFYW